MNTIPLRNHKISGVKTSQTLLMTKVCFPPKNEIQPIKNSENIQQQKIIKRRTYKQLQGKIFEVQSHATSLFKICNLDDIYQPNFQNIKNDNSHNTLKRFSTKIIKNQESLTKRSENKARIRSYSTEIQTNRIYNYFKEQPIKKVRFYEKVEYWIFNKANDINTNYKYFEPIKLN